MKRTIQISYDLSRPGDQYPALLAYLHRHRATKPLGSTWFIKTQRTPVEVRDQLLELAYEEDEFVVLDVTGVAWATTFEDVTTDWMQSEMPMKRRAV